MAVGDEICRAIAERRRLSFTYTGGSRIVEPYILGQDGDGAVWLSALQVSGGSGEGFRTFDPAALSAVAVTVTVTDQHFFRNHPDYNARDRFFASVICQV